LVQSLLEANDPAGAQAEAEALTRLDPKDWRPLDMLGIALRQQRRPADAIVQFERAARLDPRVESPWVNLARAHRDLPDYDQAIQAYRRAQEIAPNAAAIVRMLGTTLCEARNTEEGLATLSRAIMMDEGDADSFHARALALHNLGRIAEAARDIERALALKP